MIDIQKLALEAYPEKLVTVGDNPELWDENEQYRECWTEGYNKALIIQRVSQQRELLAKYTKWQNEVNYGCDELMYADIDKFLNG
jgi:hypothetical protein